MLFLIPSHQLNCRPKKIHKAFKPLQDKGTLETLKRAIQKLNEIMTYALHREIILSNPTANISKEFIAGYRMILTSENDKEHFYVHTHAFPELIHGHPKKQACQILADKGMLKRGKEKGYEFMMKLPHKVDPKRSRCYLLYPLFEPDEEEDEQELTANT